MTASEFAFLALGLVLGVASGAGIMVVRRGRPPVRPEVRLTVAPNSIARRRASTLADIDASSGPSGPARGGPGDRRWLDRDMPAEGDSPNEVQNRPDVPSDPQSSFLAGGGGSSVGIAIAHEPDPMMTALLATAAARARVLAPSGIESTVVAPGRTSIATLQRPHATNVAAAGDALAHTGDVEAHEGASTPMAASGDSAPAGRPAAEAAPGRAPASTPATAARASPDPGDAIAGACDEPRRIADERCQVATRAREGAQTALETLRSAQRAYDEHVTQAEGHAATADPRAVRTAKEAAQQEFRAARSGGRSQEDVETAARDWLTEVNRINQATREASAMAERHRVAAAALAADLERLSVEADAARISAESADEACVAAREAVAACQEAATILAARGRTGAPPMAPPARPARPTAEPSDEESMGSRAGEDAVIIRLLRGDREALTRLVARLGGDDEAERRRWQMSIGDLLEALVARSMEASAFDFPIDHPFWGPFTRSQCRDITAALSSLGYKHDGFGSWADDHMPGQRDLSLAVGYAGLDPMRIRHWPSDAEMKGLMSEVTVAADEYVWEAAGTLTLGDLVSLLGRRADGLTELWNEWGRVRPLLLAAE